MPSTDFQPSQPPSGLQDQGDLWLPLLGNSRRTVRPGRWLAVARTERFEPDTRPDAAQAIPLALRVGPAVAGMGSAIVVPKPGERFPEFYLLPGDDNGGLVMPDYPIEFIDGKGNSSLGAISWFTQRMCPATPGYRQDFLIPLNLSFSPS